MAMGVVSATAMLVLLVLGTAIGSDPGT